MGPGNIWYAIFGNNHQICHNKGCELDIKILSWWHVIYMSFCILLHINHPNQARSNHSFLPIPYHFGKSTSYSQYLLILTAIIFRISPKNNPRWYIIHSNPWSVHVTLTWGYIQQLASWSMMGTIQVWPVHVQWVQYMVQPIHIQWVQYRSSQSMYNGGYYWSTGQSGYNTDWPIHVQWVQEMTGQPINDEYNKMTGQSIWDRGPAGSVGPM